MKKKTKTTIKRNLQGFLFVTPLIAYFLVFQLLPMVIAFVISFSNWDGLNEIGWVGVDNYVALFSDRVMYPYFWKSLLVPRSWLIIPKVGSSINLQSAMTATPTVTDGM